MEGEGGRGKIYFLSGERDYDEQPYTQTKDANLHRGTSPSDH